MTDQGVIGRNNQLPWHLPADLAHFKRLTLHKPVIMGRKVYQTIGKPLPDRHNIVLSRNTALSAPGCQMVTNLTAALEATAAQPQVAIIGGAEIYKLFFLLTDRIELTLVHGEISGDVYFPTFDSSEWRETWRSEHPADTQHAYPMTFSTLERCRPQASELFNNVSP